MIPRYIYRGDSDSSNVRRLHSVNPLSTNGYLLTNLSKDGYGKEIFNQSLIESINTHVELGWIKTHFLSFSESEERARYFASNKYRYQLEESISEQWDSAVIRIETSQFLNISNTEEGVFECKFERKMPLLKLGPSNMNMPVSILLIDVQTFINVKMAQGFPNLDSALSKATDDSEWLVLPTDIFPDNPSEYTSKLDAGCVSGFDTFNFKSKQ